jgi:hypothetical protein
LVVRYKRYDTDAMEKFMTLLFITEDSYRMAGVSQALGMDTQRTPTWTALAAERAGRHQSTPALGTGPMVRAIVGGAVQGGAGRGPTRLYGLN